MHIISIVVSYVVVHVQQLVILVIEAQSEAIQIQLWIERWKSLMMVKILFLLLLLLLILLLLILFDLLELVLQDERLSLDSLQLSLARLLQDGLLLLDMLTLLHLDLFHYFIAEASEVLEVLEAYHRGVVLRSLAKLTDLAKLAHRIHSRNRLIEYLVDELAILIILIVDAHLIHLVIYLPVLYIGSSRSCSSCVNVSPSEEGSCLILKPTLCRRNLVLQLELLVRSGIISSKPLRA